MNKILILVMISMLSLSHAGFAKLRTFTKPKSVTCEQYGVLDLEFSGKNSSEPFAVEFGAVFRGPENAQLRVPGFYNGANKWVVRFSAPAAGEWSFTTFSSNKSLAGKSGRLTVTEKPSNVHGPITVSPNDPQDFVYADGEPYFLLAFECDWLFALDAENPHDIPKTRTLVEAIAEHDFNQIVMNVFAYDTSWPADENIDPKFDYGSPTVFPFLGTNENPDFSSLNVEYFQRFDRVIELLNENGIVSHLMIYVWNKLVNWPDMYSNADNIYFDYVVARYQAFPNLIWDVSKEALDYGRCDDQYILERISRIRKQDAFNRLLTVHDYGFCQEYPQSVDFISVQSWATNEYQHMREIRKRHSNKPIFNIEHGGYERSPYVIFPGDYNDPIECLKRNYLVSFAGVYSTYYWQATSWAIVIPDPFALPLEQQPFFSGYHSLHNLFSDYDFHSLAPGDGYASSGLCLTDAKDVFMFFIQEKQFALHVTLPQSVKSVKARWFSPLTGEYTEPISQPVQRWTGFHSPDTKQFWVLVLEKE